MHGNLSPVPFHGNTLFIVPLNEEPYTPMKPIVEGMGMCWRTQAAKLRNNKERWGVAVIATPSGGGQQDAVCLPVRKLPAWMASISPRKVKEEIRSRVVLYQKECDNALWDYWTKEKPKAEPQPALPRRSTAKERNKLAALMDTYIGAMGVNPSPEAYKAAWRKIHSFFGVHRVEDLAADQVPIAERFLQELIESARAKGEPTALPSARSRFGGMDMLLSSDTSLAFSKEKDEFSKDCYTALTDAKLALRTVRREGSNPRTAAEMLLSEVRALEVQYDATCAAIHAFELALFRVDRLVKIASVL